MGIFDETANRGHIFVGTSHDTPAFAADCISRWWKVEGRSRYPRAGQMLILADSGGSNGSRPRAWKYNLMTKLCVPHGLTITTCHYPPGASKWNPIEHRLFSQVSKNWAGEPLATLETMLNSIRTTKTETGLRVRATLMKGDYPKGIKPTATEMATLPIRPHDILPEWNYTIAPPENGK
ncbi:MAG: ISAzo13 family transposase [Elusimicrobia bacterium]|nr:ISAzo13 family transposase [Elusimicrobiota bacterium]